MVNKVILVGNLGSDPEIKSLSSGVKVANFSVATSDRYKDKDGEWKEKTEWHKVVLWRGLADIAEKYLNKGSMVYVEGKLQTREWDKDGEKRYSTEVVGEAMKMLGGKNQEKKQAAPQPQAEKSSLVDSEDDLPF